MAMLSPPFARTALLQPWQARAVKFSLHNSISVSSARAPSSAKPVTKDELERFWQWLTAKDGMASSATAALPEIVPQRLGLVAKKDISNGGIVFEVPRNLWIDMNVVMASEIGPVCHNLRPWVAISLFILAERFKPDSPWSPYLRILPRALDSPIFWSEEELAEIQGTQLLSTTMGYKNYVANEFSKLQEEVIIPNSNLFDISITEEDLLWAFGILRSRTFPPLTGESLSLVPFADLVNHCPSIQKEQPGLERKSAGIFSSREVLAMRAPTNFKPGQQVMMQYGSSKSNAQLALDYGIVERNNTVGLNRDVFTLTLEISESDPFFADKLDIVEVNDMETTAYFDITQGQELPESLFTYLRLAALGGADAFLLEPLFRNSVWGHLSLPVSQENEEAVCKVILDGCQSALSGYATTIEEDEALLDNHMDSRKEIAIVTRLGEKKVLYDLENFFEQYIQGLGYLEYYQERRLKRLGLLGEKGEIIPW